MSKSTGTDARVQVAVRARPLNQREVEISFDYARLISLFLFTQLDRFKIADNHSHSRFTDPSQ